ncbi:hypothetical protein N7451_005441 [Penicillium sp. IBT 35674x]|nr:hypothetical protein N7451_005441 [Penicillium sp. IBT 35674x]
MGNFTRRDEGNDSYVINQQMTVPGTYSHSGGHEFNTTGSGSYHFPQHSFTPYGSQFAPSYGQQSGLSAGIQHLQYPDHTIPSMAPSDDMRLHSSSSQYMPEPRYLPTRYLPLREALSETEIEDQGSHNEGTMLSEAVVPPLDGFPDVKEFDLLMQSYVNELSVKKQDKALIHAKRARNIKNVLMEPKDTAIESAQFRFWVKKMFKLQSAGMGTADCRKMICHEGEARRHTRETIQNSDPGAQAMPTWWTGQDLCSSPTHLLLGSKGTDLSLREDLSNMSNRASRSPKLPSPPISRRESTFGQVSLDRAQSDYFGQLHGHGWVDSHQSLQGRSTLSPGIRPAHGPMGSLTHSMTGSLDHFAELSVPGSQLSYTAGYGPSYGPPPQREY